MLKVIDPLGFCIIDGINGCVWLEILMDLHLRVGQGGCGGEPGQEGCGGEPAWIGGPWGRGWAGGPQCGGRQGGEWWKWS